MDTETVLKDFDAEAAKVPVGEPPFPAGKSEEWISGQTIGIAQGLKIARTILDRLCQPRSQ